MSEPSKITVDHVVASEIKTDTTYSISANVAEGLMGLDIGPKTIGAYSQVIATAKTVIWNGPMGIFEMNAFSNGSRQIAVKLSQLKDAVTVIGGGDTAACVTGFGLDGKMSHISTGGGASLEYLEGKVLPGIAALGAR